MTTLNITAACDLYATTDTRRALEVAVRDGYRIDKYADPVEGAREGLTVDEALEVATEDAGLIYLTRTRYRIEARLPGQPWAPEGSGDVFDSASEAEAAAELEMENDDGEPLEYRVVEA